MDERRGLLHTIELSLAASPWAESVCLGLCAPMSMTVSMSLLVFTCGIKKLPHRNVQPLPAAACGQGQQRTERDRCITSDFQDKVNEDESASMKICVTLPFCYRLRPFIQEQSKHFLPDGGRT